MILTKFGHSCIRVEGPAGTIVIDPGGLTEAAALDGADSILITHEHFDHFLEARVRAAAQRNPRVELWTVGAVGELLDGFGRHLHVIGHGDTFTTAGFDVRAYGNWHAQVHRDIPLVRNTGFLIDGSLFHPGDAFTVPDVPVTTLMVPVHGVWSRISDVIDWVREVSPRRVIAVHDAALNGIGIAVVNGLLGEHGPGIGAPFRRLEPVEHIDCG